MTSLALLLRSWSKHIVCIVRSFRSRTSKRNPNNPEANMVECIRILYPVRTQRMCKSKISDFNMPILIGEVELDISRRGGGNKEHRSPVPHHIEPEVGCKSGPPSKQHSEGNEERQTEIPSHASDNERPVSRAEVPVTSSTNLSHEENAILGGLDLDRVLSLLRLLGYESPAMPNALDDEPAFTFFHRSIDPIHRLRTLLQGIHTELNNLMPILNQRSDVSAADVEVRAWQEDILTRLLIEVVPGLSILSERVGRETAASLNSHRGGVKLNVGGSKTWRY